MSVVKASIFDGGLQRQALPGDVIGAGEVINALATAGAGVLTAALLIGGILNRTGPGAGYIDTTDTAANIVAALAANYSYQQSATAGLSSGYAVPNGLTFRFRFINTVAFANTMAAGTGVTLVNGTVNASSVKEYLVTVTNGMPTQVFAANQVNGSAVITGLTQFQTSQLAPGMLVTGTNIPGGTTVLSVQVGVGVTLSANATATLNLNALTFSPTVTITGLGQGLL